MQIDPTQCHFLHLIIKISNIKNVLEIGTFTGLSALSISLALPEDGKLIALDKNEKTNELALKFFKKAKQDHKINLAVPQIMCSGLYGAIEPIQPCFLVYVRFCAFSYVLLVFHSK